jgi:hypothetical protein
LRSAPRFNCVGPTIGARYSLAKEFDNITISPLTGEIMAMPRPILRFNLVGLILMSMLAVVPKSVVANNSLGRDGYLIIEGVRDSLSEFSRQDGPKVGFSALVWPEGTLSLPDSIAFDDFGLSDVGTPCLAALSGVGNSGRLVFEDGIYPISEPVLLADGILELHLSGGELEIRGTQLRYRRPQVEDKSQKSNLIFLSGLVLLIIVLMRRARKKLRVS